MGALFGSLGALSIGLSDLFGRRVVLASSALTATVAMQFVAFLTSLVATLLDQGAASVADLTIGAVSGIGLGIGLSFYYGGLQRSSAAVVAPLVATLAAVIPFAVTAITGAPPSAAALVGAAIAVAGLGLITAGGSASGVRAGLLWGTVSGLGYGIGTAVLTEVSASAGQWPAVSQRVAAFVLLAAVATGRGRSIVAPAGYRVAAVLAGALAGLTTIFIILGVASDPRATVVTVSMFPAASVAVGWLVFRDAVSRLQVVGLVAVLAGVAAVVAG
ncbi:MAG: EamA family transporter [Actinomycetota bacterium]